MPIVIGCLMPHPPIIIPQIGKSNIDRITSTVSAMKDVSEEIANSNPEVLVFVSPHSAGFADTIAIKGNPALSGSFSAFGTPEIKFTAVNDLMFVNELMRAANDLGLSVTKVGPGHIELSGSDKLDHGVLVPLYYIREKGIDLPVVSISIDYRGFDEHYALGMAIQQASNAIPRRVALIASGDLSHRLIQGAPAGYSPRAVDFDAKIEEIFDTGYFDELKELEPTLIEDAGECGLRSIYALAGAFNGIEVRSRVLSYEGPFGVGYMVAHVHPIKPSAERDLYTMEIEELPPTKPIEPGPSAPVILAIYGLEQYFKQGHPVKAPEDTPSELLNKRAGVFVCLKVDGNLRGCVGTINPTQDNIAEEIIANAIQAATADFRFSPLTIDELPKLQYTVDILEEPQPVQSKSMLDHKVYGIIVRRGYKTGLLLPDIEGVDSVDEQIEIARRKAGIAPREEIEIYRFRVIRYE